MDLKILTKILLLGVFCIFNVLLIFFLCIYHIKNSVLYFSLIFMKCSILPLRLLLAINASLVHVNYNYYYHLFDSHMLNLQENKTPFWSHMQ